MARYMKSTATARRICRWKCAWCGKQLIGAALITAEAKQSYGVIGVTKDKAASNVQSAATQEVYNRIRKVNEQHKIPDGVQIDGKCPSCGHKQPWAYHTEPQILLGVLSVALGIASFFLLLYFSERFDVSYLDGSLALFLAFFGSVGVFYGAVKLSKNLLESIAWKRSGGDKESCYPVLIDSPETQD